MRELQWAAEGARYTPTEEDFLWLRRSVAAEGGVNRIETAAALINGFMFARARTKYRRSLSDYVQAYSQPVNPRWFVGGDLFEASLARAKTAAERAKMTARAEMRPKYAAADVFTPVVQSAVAIAMGNAPTVPNATDFAAPTVKKQAPWLTLTTPARGANTLFARPGAADWSGYRIELTEPRFSDARVIGTVFVAVVVAAAAATGSKR